MNGNRGFEIRRNGYLEFALDTFDKRDKLRRGADHGEIRTRRDRHVCFKRNVFLVIVRQSRTAEVKTKLTNNIAAAICT